MVSVGMAIWLIVGMYIVDVIIPINQILACALFDPAHNNVLLTV